jgi:hypothetical protein
MMGFSPALRGVGVAAAFAVAAPGAAVAQPAPPFDSAIDVQTFEYAVGPKTFFTVADGDVAARDQLSVDALVTFLTRPFQIYNVDATNPNMVTGTRTTVIKSMTAAQLTAAYGVTDRLQLGVNLPIIFALQGDGLMPATGAPATGGLSVTGLGDLVVEAKLRLTHRGAFRASAIGGLSLPSSVGSGGSQFIGDDLPTLRGKLAAQLDTGRLSFGANAGVILRQPRTIYSSTIGQQLTWGVAGAARLTDRFSLIAEGYGRAGLPSFSLDASPLEVEGGLRIYATSAVAVVIGGGAGIVNGIGSPGARFFISLGYAPDVRDSDGDGIPNGRDKCPNEPEDKDGFEDEDGCPDPDNDGDHRPDVTDKCPNEAEDIDGFEDDDGCPDPDNDKDGIPDLLDKCPNEPEDGKPPYPKDGCPAAKGDALAAPDPTARAVSAVLPGAAAHPAAAAPPSTAAQAAPAQPADAAAAACPEPDRDHDGIPDAQDRCPDEPETVNGVDDEDGCPDTGGIEVVKLSGDRLAIDRLPTLDRGKLSRGGEIIVDQMALVMRGHADVTRWLIAIAAPSATTAKQIAGAVTARLIARGVAADRVTILTAAGKPKIGGVVQARADADASAACAPRPAAP